MPRPRGSKNKPKDQAAPKPARKHRVPVAPAAQAASSQNSAHEFKKPAPEDIVSLVTELDVLDGDKKDLADSGKEWIDRMAEMKGLDKKGFSWARAMWKYAQKEPEKFAISFPHCLSYVADLGLAERADAARGLEINGEPNQPDIPQETTGAETAWPDDQQVRSRLSVVPAADSDAA